jgi:hypothetical protein
MQRFITNCKVQKEEEQSMCKKEKWARTSGSLSIASLTSNRAKPEGVSSSVFFHLGSLYTRFSNFPASANANAKKKVSKPKMRRFGQTILMGSKHER